MPDESCRNCGAELEIETTCSECNQAIQQICPKCNYKTLERIHFDCTYGLEMSTHAETMQHPSEVISQ